MDSYGGALLLSGTQEAMLEARAYHRTAVEAKVALWGRDDLRTLDSRQLYYSNAAWIGNTDGLVEAAEGMAEVVQIRQEKLGREHGLTLLGMIYLARIKVDLQDFQAAEEIFNFILPVGERNHGKDHMGVLFAGFHKGRMRARQARWTEARDILVDVTERQKVSLQGFGRGHYDRIGGLRVLAEVHYMLGEHEECDAVVEETMLGFDKITTVEHPWAIKLREDHAKWKAQRSVTVPAA
jgi:hypothetical protein